ncbi:riboflavin biosynthesis chloroplastic [Raphidocelis subcapitata]|uniref:5-amino-6-(5-phosphoribosylamino)uracil reductase n=1 Tax=Raphidocelis subcapitata TaxID=307507 RepID=A0A2V0PN62_9CHLO|nr:riboflavin biosynthesis chloroplastic [Raphidocelis subcapitata]|eukprot:GBF98837.1 riboflavin biosynthesis chloroplastic [Raphidocelis subcapitata]
MACSGSARRGQAATVCPASSPSLSDADLSYIIEAAELAGSSAGLTQPHPNAACLLVAPSGAVVSRAFQRAHGSTPAEVLAASAARGAAAGATAYLNLESGDCHGDDAAVAALIQSGVSRVVVGLRHPLRHLRNRAVAALRAAGVRVDVLAVRGVAAASTDGEEGREDPESAALLACLRANEGLLHRAALRRPMSVLKYAMTLDGKIATTTGHAAWVSSPSSRARVFEMRARSDAVVVGGNTVRRDNPNLTTRREGGFAPWRIVMSRSLDLPAEANLWDVSVAPTIVMTQRGARQSFQKMLRSKGVEVVEFDFLNPESVAEYCYERGFLQVFWECGGMLAAPAISSGVVHKVMAFVAPKIIGGERAPCPVGELGFVEMTQAVNLVETQYTPSGPDILISGYLPSSGGLLSLERSLSYPEHKPASLLPGAWGAKAALKGKSPADAAATEDAEEDAAAAAAEAALGRNKGRAPRVISFYKAWDEWGALGNFSPHPIRVTNGGGAAAAAAAAPSAAGGGEGEEWPSVEHYYQAAKFSGVDSPAARELVAAIKAAPSPEEAARIGRRAERGSPELVRPDWPQSKRAAMTCALRAKYTQHAGPRRMLLSTAGDAAAGVPPAQLVEASPNDHTWGQGFSGGGQNQLGQLLMQLREELVAEEEAAQAGLQHEQRLADQQQQQQQQQRREALGAAS